MRHDSLTHLTTDEEEERERLEWKRVSVHLQICTYIVEWECVCVHIHMCKYIDFRVPRLCQWLDVDLCDIPLIRVCAMLICVPYGSV